MRRHAAGLDRLDIEGRNVREVLQAAERRHPGLTRDLFEGRDLQAGITIAINDAIVDDPLSTPLEPDSEIYIVPAMSGG